MFTTTLDRIIKNGIIIYDEMEQSELGKSQVHFFALCLFIKDNMPLFYKPLQIKSIRTTKRRSSIL